VVALKAAARLCATSPTPRDCLGADEVKLPARYTVVPLEAMARRRPSVRQVGVGASAVPPRLERHRHHRAQNREDERQQPEPSDASRRCQPNFA
jgi:hypothetical protein